MRHALEPLRAIGIRLVYYLDDICVVARTKEEMEDHTQMILTQLTNLGFLIDYEKSDLIPKHHSANQDIETDFTDKTTAEEQATIFLLMDCWSFGENDSNDPSNWRSIASCGTYTKGSSEQPSPEQPKLGEKLPNVNSKFEGTRLVEEPSIAVEWPPDHTQGSERTRSLKYAKKSGGTASLFLQGLALEIQEVTATYNLQVRYQHIQGIKNVQADALSRKKKPLYEWKLPRRFFKKIQEQWRPLKINAFATRANTRLRRFWSLNPDPQAEAINAWRQRWL
ncbi:hypothetical protein G6F43_012917 [Rhizopus delemar]|nr:hypothetical protein G6F43_012917 [Rhizopus delemar]